MKVLNLSHYLLCAKCCLCFLYDSVSSADFATNAEVGYGIDARYQCYKAAGLRFRAICVQCQSSYIYCLMLLLHIATHLPRCVRRDGRPWADMDKGNPLFLVLSVL